MKNRIISGRLAAVGMAAWMLLSACGGGGADDGGVAVGTGTSSGGGETSGGGTSGGGTSGGGTSGGGTSGGGAVSTFTIGGSVTGLTVAGLALQNNGADRLTVASGAATFKFATAVLSGAAYDVSFASYPYGLACSLTAGSGVATGDVASVAIACANWTSANATVSVFAGSTAPGTADGTGSAARFNWPYGLGFDASGTAFVADRGNNMIRKITPAGLVSTLAGSTTSGSLDGTGASARFNDPRGIVTDATGNIYVADYGNNLIRKITPAGVVTTLAGTTAGGNVDGTGVGAEFQYPWGLAIDGSGNLFVADQGNHEIRKVTAAGVVTTFAGGGPLASGFLDATGTAARFSSPSGLSIDADGNLYVGDYGNNAIRKITPAGVVSTLAGSGASGAADGTGAAATFSSPLGVASDAVGNVYVADYGNNRIRKISASGVVTTLAGTSPSGYTDGLGSTAKFNTPNGIALDAIGNVYVADRSNNMIRKIARVP